MKWRLTMVVLLTGVLAAPAPAQQRDQADQRRREEVVRRLEAAVRELQQTLEQARREQTVEVRRRLEDVMQELRRAQAQLGGRRSIIYAGDSITVLDRARLVGGVRVITNTREPQMGVYLDYAADQGGARIESVVRDGPSDKAGLRGGDVITTANSRDLTGERRAATQLVEIKNAMEVGDTLRVEYRRGSETRTANIVLDRVSPSTIQVSPSTIQLGDLPQADLHRRLAERAAVSAARSVSLSWGLPAGWLDIELISLDEDLGRYFGTSEGLLVVRAPKDETLQLRSGDVILQVDGREPTDQSHLMRILRSYAPGETMTLSIMREDRKSVV